MPSNDVDASSAPVASPNADALAALRVVTKLAETWLDDKVSGMLGTGAVDESDAPAADSNETREVDGAENPERAVAAEKADSVPVTKEKVELSAAVLSERAASAQARDAYDVAKLILEPAPVAEDDPTRVETTTDAQDRMAA